MKKALMSIYSNNRLIVWAAVVAILLSVAILVMIKDEVTRFTLIMPIFAGFILFSILVTPDEELEDEEVEDEADKPVKKSKSRKSR